MNTPVLLGLLALVALGLEQFMRKVGAENGVYGPSFMLAAVPAFVLMTILMHFVQKHSFSLSPKMMGVGLLAGIFGAISVFAVLLAFRLGGHGSTIFPLVGLGMIVSAGLSFIVYSEPVTATKLLGLGLGVGSIIALSR